MKSFATHLLVDPIYRREIINLKFLPDFSFFRLLPPVPGSLYPNFNYFTMCSIFTEKIIGPGNELRFEVPTQVLSILSRDHESPNPFFGRAENPR